METIVIDLINFIEKYFGGRVTDCGGEFVDKECEFSCKQYHQCKRNYNMADELEALKKRALKRRNI